MAVLVVIKEGSVTTAMDNYGRSPGTIGPQIVPHKDQIKNSKVTNVWLAAILSNGVIVGTESQLSQTIVSLLIGSRDNNTVLLDEIKGLQDIPTLPEQSYSSYVKRFGVHPYQLAYITQGLTIPTEITLGYIQAIVNNHSGEKYRMAYIENDDFAEDLLISCGLLNKSADYKSIETDKPLINNGREPSVCQYCGLGWITQEQILWPKIQKSISTVFGLRKTHYICSRKFFQLWWECAEKVSKAMKAKAASGFTKVLHESVSVDSVENSVRNEAAILASTPIQTPILPDIKREDLVIWQMRDSLADLIIQESQDHVITKVEDNTLQNLIKLYGFNRHRLNPISYELDNNRNETKGVVAIRRMETCRAINEIINGNRNVYVGPPKENLPFNIRSRETLYWAWNNAQYQHVRTRNVRESTRSRVGTAPGVNSVGSTTTNFRSTDSTEDVIESLGNGYLGITNRSLYFSSADGQTVRIDFERIVAINALNDGIAFQESYVQGDRKWPQRFVGLDGWEINLVVRTLQNL